MHVLVHLNSVEIRSTYEISVALFSVLIANFRIVIVFTAPLRSTEAQFRFTQIIGRCCRASWLFSQVESRGYAVSGQKKINSDFRLT
jgi:hypothetical protein